MRGGSYSQKSLQVRGRSGGMRVQSPASRRCPESSSSRRGGVGVRGTAVVVATELHRDSADEKEEMQETNFRFASYIEKVQALQERNAALRVKLASLQSQYRGGPAGMGEEYELKYKELKDLIGTLTNEKGAADIERGYVVEEVDLWRAKLDEELALKEEAEIILGEFRKDIDDATLQRADLEKQVEMLVAEIEFLKNLHDEEVANVLEQIEDSKISAELTGDRPDLAAYLRDIRMEVQAVAASKVQEAEKWYKGKFDTLRDQAGKNEDKIRAAKAEIVAYNSKVTDLQNQIAGLRARNAALERQLDDMEAAHAQRAGGLEETITQLENQLCETKLEMSQLVRDYQELLHVKLKLDAEIATYKKLLEGEEKRLGMSVLNKAV